MPRRLDGVSWPTAPSSDQPELSWPEEMTVRPYEVPVGHVERAVAERRSDSFVMSTLKAGGRMTAELLVASVLMFVVLSLPSYWQRFQVRFNAQGNAATTFEALSLPVSADPFSQAETGGKQVAGAVVTEAGQDELKIPSLSIEAPAAFGVGLAEADGQLLRGVVQLDSSKRPDEPGPVFIVGHSSTLPWVQSDYGRVFASLPDIQVGSTISVRYHGQRYEYKVREKKTVKPTEISYENKSQLILMTCVPIGTRQNRLLVFADPV